MALVGTDRGTGTHNTSATSFTLTPGSNFSAGSLAVLCVAADNSASAGSSNDFTSVTDTAGNVWRLSQRPIFDNGAASAGVQGCIAVTDMSAGTLTTGTTVTVSFGSSPTAKTWTLMEIVPTADWVPLYLTGGVQAAGQSGTTAPSFASGTVTVNDMVIMAVFMESGTTQTCTGDSDTTNGTWSTVQYNEIGSTTSGSCIASQRKIQTTADSTQTLNLTLGLGADTIGAWIIVTERKVKPFSTLGVG